MKTHSALRAFNFNQWLKRNRDQLRPPVGNKLLHEDSGMIVMVVGGPNTRVDFHDDPVEEWFYQLKGDMVLKIADDCGIFDVPIREGEVFLLPPHTIHAPQRPQEDSVGIVVESPRMMGMKEGFLWYCFGCERLVHRVDVPPMHPAAIVETLPKIYEAFHADEQARTCGNCGELHPGKGKPPVGWVTT